MKTILAVAFLCAIVNAVQCAHLYHKKGQLSSMLDQLEEYVRDARNSIAKKGVGNNNQQGEEIKTVAEEQTVDLGKVQGKREYKHYKLHDGKEIYVKRENHFHMTEQNELRENTADKREDETEIDKESNAAEEHNEEILYKGHHIDKRGISNAVYKWPAGQIKFAFADDYPKKDEVRQVIKDFNTYFSCTGAQWVEKTASDTSYFVRVQLGNGCRSYLGYLGRYQQFHDAGFQFLELKEACLQKPGVIMHEMLHAMGFSHEQSRSDRDKYIKIQTAHVAPGFEHNFDKDQAFHADALHEDYDYGSVMQYSRKAFSRDGQDTIVAITNGQPNEENTAKMGQREKLSDGDIRELNYFYCGSTSGGSGPTTAPPATTAPPNGVLTDCNHDSGKHCKIMDGCKQTQNGITRFIQSSEHCANSGCNCEATVTAESTTSEYCYIFSCSGPAAVTFKLGQGAANVNCPTGEHYFMISVGAAHPITADLSYTKVETTSSISNVRVYNQYCDKLNL